MDPLRAVRARAALSAIAVALAISACAGGTPVVRPGGTMSIPRPDAGAPLDARLRTGTVMDDLRSREAPGTLLEPLHPPDLDGLDSGVALVSYDNTSLCVRFDDHQPATVRTRIQNPYESADARLETSDGISISSPTRSRVHSDAVTVRVAVGESARELTVEYLRHEAQLCFVHVRPILSAATQWVRISAKLGDAWQAYTWTLDGTAPPPEPEPDAP